MAVLGKNNQKTAQQFIFRKYYDVIYYPKDYTNIIDFWKNSLLYGKVDTELDSVMVNTNYLKVLKTNSVVRSTQNYAVSFVADSFNEMVLEFQRADQFKIIPKSKLNPLNVSNSIIIPKTKYDETIKLFLDSSFTKSILKDKTYNLKDFLNYFISIISNTSLNVSQTSFVSSNISSPSISGLVIELAFLDHGEDRPKASQYLEDPNYQFFINTAEKYSFFVDKNAPWRLVYNVSTSFAAEKMKTYNFNSVDEMFSNVYSKTYLSDWKELKTLLTDYYKNNVETKLKVQRPELNCDSSIVNKSITKELLADNTYNDLFWIKLYYFVRLREEDIRLSQIQFENKLRQLTNIYNSSGEISALQFINKDTKPFLDGGTNPSYSSVIEVSKSKKLKTSNFIYKL